VTGDGGMALARPTAPPGCGTMPDGAANAAADGAADPVQEAVLAALDRPVDQAGAPVAAYEATLAAWLGMTDAVAVATDSATVTVLAGALGLEPGDEVVLPPDAPPWITGALREARLQPVTAAIEPGGAALAAEAVAAALTDRTRAILQVARRDRALDPGPCAALAARYGLTQVADVTATVDDPAAAPALAGTVDVALVATGPAGPLSTGPLSTGEGGALGFHDAALAGAARRFSRFGGLDGESLGVNQKLAPLAAALGRARLAALAAGTGPVRAADVVGPEPEAMPLEPMADTPVPDRFDPRVPADAREVTRALAGDLSGDGEPVHRYETALAAWFGAEHALSTASGYAAIVVALAALGLAPGDEVILAPTCPLCTVYALTTLGVVPVFCDTRPDDFSIDLGHADRLIGPRTRAILEVPMWGHPVPADAVAAFARSRGLAFVMDLALAHAVELDGKLAWRHADVAVFSTHASKTLPTGEGGFLLTDDGGIAEAARRYRHYGDRPSGMNYRLGGLQAALGLARLPLLAAHLRHRRAVMDALATTLADHPRLEALPVIPGGTPSGVKMIVREKSGNGTALNAHLARHGVPSDIRLYACRPLYEFPILADRRADCPNATRLLSSIATLPVHPDIDRDRRDRIAKALATYGEAAS